jgi:Mn2+/Fe2+ NRAMP family transporter
MGKYANGWFLLIAGWTSCTLITALDVYLLVGMFTGAGEGGH